MITVIEIQIMGNNGEKPDKIKKERGISLKTLRIYKVPAVRHVLPGVFPEICIFYLNRNGIFQRFEQNQEPFQG